MREQTRLLDIQKRAEKLASFCREVNKVIFLKELPPSSKMTDEEMVEKFKIKATGMIEDLTDIISKE